ncbi:hypothetical protein C0995_000148 [Termitomyces sp. Mi166|nr:hypothetical protein C0995_000148 [Termitomyces sp. Mi166\
MSEPDGRQAPIPLIDAPLNAQTSHTSMSSSSLKRSASEASFGGCEGDNSRKRMKEDKVSAPKAVDNSDATLSTISSTLADDLARELECGCCSDLVYRPVLVNPCQHFFCGSCCVLWIRNGGTNCPACRGPSTVVTPFRALQSVVDTLLRAAPHKARPERERQQADEIYKAGHSIRIPPPREPSPEADMEAPSDFARPCPHCAPNNPYGWRCPQPVPDPATDIDHAWHLEDGLPPGHAHCDMSNDGPSSNYVFFSENLLATHAPNTTTKCDLCQVYFCGIGVRDRCIALPLRAQQPHGLSNVGDLILSSDVYDCFNSNNVEVEIMLDYITAQEMTPPHIYREAINHILSSDGSEQAAAQLEQTTTEPQPPTAEPEPSSTALEVPLPAPTGLQTPSVRDVLEPPEVRNLTQSFWNVFSRENTPRVQQADALSN